jgi:hypothetical protein
MYVVNIHTRKFKVRETDINKMEGQKRVMIENICFIHT